MKYKLINATQSRMPIGDRREKIDIQTVDMVATNDFSGEFEDSLVIIAANVWAGLKINRGVNRMLGINTDKEEIVTHTFYVQYWNTDFLEARFITWNENIYRIIRSDNMNELVDANFQINFPCVLKGDKNKNASMWAE